MGGKTMWLLFVEAWKSNVTEHAEVLPKTQHKGN